MLSGAAQWQLAVPVLARQTQFVRPPPKKKKKKFLNQINYMLFVDESIGAHIYYVKPLTSRTNSNHKWQKHGKFIVKYLRVFLHLKWKSNELITQ